MTGNSPEICLLYFHTSTSGRHIAFVQGIREVKGFMPHRYALVICACTSLSGDVVIQKKNTELKRVYRGKRGGDKAAPKKTLETSNLVCFQQNLDRKQILQIRQSAGDGVKEKCVCVCERELFTLMLCL